MRLRLVGLLEAAAALTVCFSLVTLFDRLHHGIELFAHFRLQYFVVSLLLAATLGALRRRAYAVVLLLTAIVNGIYVVPWYFGASDGGGAPLEILHANVHASNAEHQRVIALVRDESPDIVVLQEVTGSWAREMRALESEYAFHYTESREDNFGIAIYSRLPLSSVSHLDSPPLGYPTLIAKVDVKDQALTLISSHPTIPVGAQGYMARNEQLAHIAKTAAETTGTTVMIGDLNSTMWSSSYRSFVSQSGLSDARRGFGILPSWPTFMPFAMIPIDHALVSDDVTVIDFRTGAHIGSDHLPVLVTIGL